MKNMDSLSIEAFCYPTEELGRVKKALLAVSGIEPTAERAEMQFGVGMHIVCASTKKQMEIREAVERIKPAVDRVEERVDEKGVFHLRLDKQAAYAGEIKRGKGIEVRIKFMSYPFRIEDVRKLAGEAFGIL